MNSQNFYENLPRKQHFLFKEMIANEKIINSFRDDPVSFLKRNGVDASELKIPRKDEMPSKEVMLKRLEYYFGYEEFAYPAKLAIPFIVFVVFLIPIPVHYK